MKIHLLFEFLNEHTFDLSLRLCNLLPLAWLLQVMKLLLSDSVINSILTQMVLNLMLEQMRFRTLHIVQFKNETVFAHLLVSTDDLMAKQLGAQLFAGRIKLQMTKK